MFCIWFHQNNSISRFLHFLILLTPLPGTFSLQINDMNAGLLSQLVSYFDVHTLQLISYTHSKIYGLDAYYEAFQKSDRILYIPSFKPTFNQSCVSFKLQYNKLFTGTFALLRYSAALRLFINPFNTFSQPQHISSQLLQLKNLTTFAFPNHQLDCLGEHEGILGNSDQTRNFPPEVAVVMIHQTWIETISCQYFLQIPRYLQSSVLLIVIIDPVMKTKRYFKLCFVCSKQALHEQSDAFLLLYRTFFLEKLHLETDTKKSSWNSFASAKKLGNLGLEYQLDTVYTTLSGCHLHQTFGVKRGNRVPNPSTKSCITHLILEQMNCTSVYCSAFSSTNIFMSSPLLIDIFWSYSFSHGIPFGGVSEGIQFVTVLGIDEAKYRNSSSIFTIFISFSFIAWLCIISLLLTAAFLLRLSTKTTNNTGLGFWLFWLFSGALEKGCCITTACNYKNVSLLTAWMFGTFLLRNFYVSELLSDLMAGFEPDNLPETFQDVLPGEFKLTSKRNVDTGEITASYDVLYELELRNKKLGKHEKQLFYDNVLKNIWFFRITGSLKQALQEFSKVDGSHSCRSWHLFNNSFEIRNCNVSRRTTIMYSKVGLGTPNDVRFMIPTLEHFTQRKVVRGSKVEPLFLSRTLMWFYNEPFWFIGMFKMKLGYLVESGISNWHQTYVNAMTQIEVFRCAHLDNGNHSRNLLAFLFDDTVGIFSKDVTEQRALNLQDLQSVLVLCGICNILAVSVFIRNYFKKNFKKC